MSQLEYLVALISIIVGLGLTDLAQSVRELIRPGLAVKWDSLPLAWSAIVFTFTILLWWQGFSVLEEPDVGGGAGPVFLTFLLFFLILYLCCAFALPDPDWERTYSDWGRSSAASEGTSEESTSEEGTSGQSVDPKQSTGLRQGVNLEAFYFSVEHRRWFFGLLIGFWVTLGAANQFTFASGGATERLTAALPIVGIAALTAVPILTDRRWAHWIVVAVIGGLIGATAVRDILL
jgi:hypothetical protein